MATLSRHAKRERHAGIDHSASAPPIAIPRDHVGEFVIPGTGKRIWWTGRVAIGLRYQPQRCMEPLAASSRWVQDLMLGPARGMASSGS